MCSPTAEPQAGAQAPLRVQNQIRRLMAERDLLLSAIAPEDYAKIEPQMKAISESPDEEVTNG